MAGSATDRRMSFPPKTAPLARKALTDNNSGGYDSNETVTKLTINSSGTVASALPHLLAAFLRVTIVQRLRSRNGK
jgi:hypothetical protein